jgi:AraC family transcriptional regulator of adaptative response/methylated-DNA-[protein]-cysteine methyltransferase
MMTSAKSRAAGATATYAKLASRAGGRRTVRAVAGACAANTLAVIVPCHRIIRTEDSLSGYRWGVRRKRALVRREAPLQQAAGSSTDAMAPPKRPCGIKAGR